MATSILAKSILCFFLLFCYVVDATITENIVESISWDGIGAYIPVDRQIIQRRLDTWYDSGGKICKVPKLYLPDIRIFPNDLNESQHAVFIAPAYSKLKDFQELHDPCLSLDGIELTVTIPLLTDDPKGHPKYALALGQFYKQDRGNVAKPNLVYPYIPVEEITIENNTFIMKNGSDELRLTFQKYTDPCVPPSPVVLHEFDEFAQQEFHFGTPEPHFSICNGLTINNNYCSTAERIRCKVHRSSPNICQTSWNVLNRTVCKSSLEITNITSGFREFMYLLDDPLITIASQSVRANFSIGIKFPCIGS